MSSEVTLHEIALPDGTRVSVLWRRCAGASYCCGSGRLRLFFVNGNIRFFRGMMKRIEGLSFPPEKSDPWRVTACRQIAERTFRIDLEHPTQGKRSAVCAVRADARRRSIGVQADRTLRRINVTLPGEYSEELVPYALRLVDWPLLQARDPGFFSRGDEEEERTLRWRGREYPVRLGARSSHVEDGVLHLRAAPDASEAEIEAAYERFLRKDFEAYVGPIHERAVEETNLRPSEWGMIRRGVHTRALYASRPQGHLSLANRRRKRSLRALHRDSRTLSPPGDESRSALLASRSFLLSRILRPAPETPNAESRLIRRVRERSGRAARRLRPEAFRPGLRDARRAPRALRR